MPRRIDVELTSTRDDGSWTWRAAGAKKPKGVLDATLVPPEVKVGDVVKAEVEDSLEGVTITAVATGGRERREPERLELLGRPRGDEPLVTTVLAPKGRGGRGGRDRDRPRKRRDDRPARAERGDRTRRADEHSGRPGGAERGGAPAARGTRRSRPERHGPPPAPKAKRLRAGRAHRKELLDSLPPEQRPIAEQVLRGGIPAVRQAISKQNEQAKADGRPEVSGDELVALAERLAPKLRVAEWRDRAEAALADLEELDLRDLRSVVVASTDNARDGQARELAATLRDGLARRVERAQSEWLTQIAEALNAGRVVRALRLSSRPPKAGAPFPADLAVRLADATSASLTREATPDRWATILDALSFSPVRLRVRPAELPESPPASLLDAVRKVASRLPDIAALFGVDAPTRAKSAAPRAPRPPAPPSPADTPSLP